jgi:hypothetical protein
MAAKIGFDTNFKCPQGIGQLTLKVTIVQHHIQIRVGLSRRNTVTTLCVVFEQQTEKL